MESGKVVGVVGLGTGDGGLRMFHLGDDDAEVLAPVVVVVFGAGEVESTVMIVGDLLRGGRDVGAGADNCVADAVAPTATDGIGWIGLPAILGEMSDRGLGGNAGRRGSEGVWPGVEGRRSQISDEGVSGVKDTTEPLGEYCAEGCNLLSELRRRYTAPSAVRSEGTER